MITTKLEKPDSRLQGLYAIADAQQLGERLLPAVRACLLGGCRLIQFRDKSSDIQRTEEKAVAINEECQKVDALLIINDDVELASKVAASGVHIGKHDLPIAEARQLLGKNRLIGVSCYNQLQLAIDAERSQASYVAFGSMFPSPTKPAAIQASIKLISSAKQKLNIPVCAIGGINISNAKEPIEAGADMLALISGIFSSQNVQQCTQHLVDLFDKSKS